MCDWASRLTNKRLSIDVVLRNQITDTALRYMWVVRVEKSLALVAELADFTDIISWIDHITS